MLIGLTGKAGSGKSFAATHLMQQRGFTRVKFADPLKDMLRALGLCDDEIEGHLKETPCKLLQGKTPRLAMQTLGTEWGRNMIGQELWSSVFSERVMALQACGYDVVCDDVRFPNEAKLICDLGGTIVRIHAPCSGPTHTHASEIMEFGATVSIRNDFTPLFVELLNDIL